MQITSMDWDSAPEATRRACFDLWEMVWPTSPSTPDRQERYVGLDQHVMHVGIEAGAAVGVARTFLQTISVGSAQTQVIALASVCCHPDRRGEGWGRLVVEAAFQRASADRPALFQTEVDGFYEKLGSMVIRNPVMTSAPGVLPFKDPHVMLYPADAAWDHAVEIDLQTRGW